MTQLHTDFKLLNLSVLLVTMIKLRAEHNDLNFMQRPYCWLHFTKKKKNVFAEVAYFWNACYHRPM
jgi:hypothetical protein